MALVQERSGEEGAFPQPIGTASVEKASRRFQRECALVLGS